MAWQWKHFDVPLEQYGTTPGQFEAVPLMIDGVLYVTTPYNNVAALDAETGKELWRFDGEGYKLGQLLSASGWKLRGTAFWRDGDKLRIFLNSRHRLFKLDAQTGKPLDDFGNHGWVSLTDGLPRMGDSTHYTQSSPPVIYKDLVIMGSQIPDRVQIAESGRQVQAINARTGKRAWTFSVMPQIVQRSRRRDVGERIVARNAGTATCGRRWRSTKRADCSICRRRRQAATTTAASVPGANLFAESLVCLDANTGKMKWYFQTVHHGLWDWDIPAQPNLVTITVDGKKIDAVAQVTKRGDTFVFDRVTGKPVWPIVERPVDTNERRARREGVSDAAVPDQAAGVRAAGRDARRRQQPHAGDQGSWPKSRSSDSVTARSSRRRHSTAPGSGRPPAAARIGAARPSIRRPGILYVRANNGTSINRVGKNDGSDPLVDVDYSYTFGRGGGDQEGGGGGGRGAGGAPRRPARSAGHLAALRARGRHRPEQGRHRVEVAARRGARDRSGTTRC